MSNYWANRRRKEAQVGKPVVTATLKRVEFHIDNMPYVYEFRTDSRSGFAYIHKGQDTIYGPYASDCTDEGRKVFELVHEHIIKNKI